MNAPVCGVCGESMNGLPFSYHEICPRDVCVLCPEPRGHRHHRLECKEMYPDKYHVFMPAKATP